ncbi:BatD family protein [Phreatobacter stygius]|uniref:Protein BatD n=1 Tax=Phreatobacter stygius TaxID=1940610 RepID=A0A4D7BE56_9HYPH|nr:BatD family protein [Phreatobacter stygius]QCI68248.1 protein BatD [Phreatobacter stygius]
MRWAPGQAPAILLVLVSSTPLVAQPAPVEPAPAQAQIEATIEATLEPSTVVVGRPVRVRIRALAPNFLTQPAQFPDLQISNAVTRPAGQTSISETRGDVTLAGVMADYDIYPQEPGRFALAPATVTLTYALDPPRGTTARLVTPQLTFTATIPDAARALDPFLAAPRLTLDQTFAPEGTRFQVGDALTRTITAEADDLPAIFLPAFGASAPDGVAAYPGQPIVEDRGGDRGATGRGRRVQSVTYTFERAGDHVLPAIGLDWWNSQSGRVEHARLPALAIHVAPAPGQPAGEVAQSLVRQALLGLREHWLAVLGVVALVAGSAVVLPPLLRRLAAWWAARRLHRAASEQAAYHRLRRAARRGSPEDIYAALLIWLDRLPSDRAAAIRDKAPGDAAARPAFEIARLEQRLYGGGGRGPGAWPGGNLIAALQAARNTWKTGRRPGFRPVLPASLNPGGEPR